MDIFELSNNFKTSLHNYNYNNMAFFTAINTIADYIMYEQTIIKKDNVIGASSITYTPSNVSLNAINELISSINFTQEPIIGSSKSVIINGDDKSISSNIYLLDKIKDSLMHVQNNMTLYKFDNKYKNIIIENTSDDYSLKCIIPINALIKFNNIIKNNYYNIDPEIKWIDQIYDKTSDIEKKDIRDNNISKLTIGNYYSHRVNKYSRVIFKKNSKEKLYAIYGNNKNMYESEYLSYHTYSYLTLLYASNHDYPILNDLYNLNFNCTHPEYIQKCNKIINDMIDFYENNNFNSYMPYEVIKDKVMKHLINRLKDINMINKYILTYMRNARSHANKIGNDRLNITYFDVKYNSEELNSSLLSTPTFILEDTNENINILFDKLSTSIDLDEYINNFESRYLNTFINELGLFILQCKKDNINPNIDRLLLPLDDASNYIEFITKILNNAYNYPIVKR